MSDTFNGFPRDAFTFFAGVARNNNRDWFQKNKARYEAEEARESLAVSMGAAHEGARYRFGGKGRVSDSGRLRGIEPHAIRRDDIRDADLLAGGEQHGAMHGVLELAHVAGPAAQCKLALGFRRQRTQCDCVRLGIFANEVLGELD